MPVVSRRVRKAWLQDPYVQLMIRVRDGDDSAFAPIVEYFSPRVRGYFRKVVGDPSEAEDLAQEVFLRLYRSRASYKPRASFNTWVFHITQNVARNALRSRRRRPCVPFDLRHSEEDQPFQPLPCHSAESPSAPLERAELGDVVRSAVRTLGGRHRQAVELHQFQGRTYAEVAREMDMTPKAAKSLLYRARNQLRVTLAPFMS